MFEQGLIHVLVKNMKLLKKWLWLLLKSKQKQTRRHSNKMLKGLIINL